ncbi:MAG: YkgJ family cysteine cluster protein [Desulfobacterales bacterium]
MNAIKTIMKLEINLNKIKKLSEKNDRENWNFRSFLKGYDATIEEMDAIVHELYQKISSEIDCTICANCCKEVKPLLDQEDIKKCCEGLKVSVSQFKKKYLKSDKEEGNFVFKEKPCPFLKNNLCSIYPHRPKDCESFPHLHKKEFIFRLWGVVENCSICPIVFNVYEQLKGELWHSGDDEFADDQEDIFY